MTGAGISVSCGIPDFRSPKTGVYANLKEYDLPTPESIFTLDYFLEKPDAFYKFMQNFDLTKFDPSPTHYFIKMLVEKGILHMNMTQNIDNLEEKTGIDMEKVLQAHGANRGAHCAKCKEQVSAEAIQDHIRDNKVMRCSKCEAPCKPDIVFFGEALPARFRQFVNPSALMKVDLLLIMGTALAVSPFNMIPHLVDDDTPAVLFNLDNTDLTGGIDFTKGSTKLFVQGKCDETLTKLCQDVGWHEDF